jgi:hypothetical protein
MSSSGPEPAFAPRAELTSDLSDRCGLASPEHLDVQRLAVKSGVAPGNDRSPVCSGLGSIAEVGERCRARSSAPSVVADGGSERAKPVLVKPAAVTRRRAPNEGVPRSY